MWSSVPHLSGGFLVNLSVSPVFLLTEQGESQHLLAESYFLVSWILFIGVGWILQKNLRLSSCCKSKPQPLFLGSFRGRDLPTTLKSDPPAYTWSYQSAWQADPLADGHTKLRAKVSFSFLSQARTFLWNLYYLRHQGSCKQLEEILKLCLLHNCTWVKRKDLCMPSQWTEFCLSLEKATKNREWRLAFMQYIEK